MKKVLVKVLATVTILSAAFGVVYGSTDSHSADPGGGIKPLSVDTPNEEV